LGLFDLLDLLKDGLCGGCGIGCAGDGTADDE
jgi:hypothetical protein